MLLVLSHLSIVAFFSSMVLGLYIITRKNRPLSSITFSILTISLAAWSLGYANIYTSQTPEQAMWWYRFSSLGWASLPSVALHFTLLFSDTRKFLTRPWHHVILYIPGMVFLYRSLTGVLYTRQFVLAKNNVIEIPATDSAWFYAYLGYNMVFMTIVFIQLGMVSRNAPSNKKKKQSTIILWSFLFGSVFIYLFNIVLLWAGIRAPVVGHLAFFGGIAGVWYAIARYRFMSFSSESATREIITHMADLLFLLDQRQMIINANQQAMEITGLDIQDMGRTSFTDLLKDKSSAENLKNMIHQDKNFSNQKVMLSTSNNDYIPISISGSRVIDHYQDNLGTVIVGHDISTAKELEYRDQLLQQELDLARSIQKNLIPKQRDYPGLAIRSCYHPMAELGGDFYDFIQWRGNSKTGIFISDVSGHGVPAALITGIIKTLIFTAGDEREDPAALLDYLNRNLISLTHDYFVTAMAVIYDPSASEMTMSRAGHCPLKILRDGNIIEPHCPGKLLGILDEPGIENCTFTCYPGDRILIYTDGLLEAINAHGEMFEVKVDTIISESAHLDLDQFMSRLQAELANHSRDQEPEDDVTLIVMDILDEDVTKP